MKSIFRKTILMTSLFLSLSATKSQAAIGLISSGPAATIFIAIGAGGGLVSAWGYSTPSYDPRTFENLTGILGIIFLDSIEDELIETVKERYQFLDTPTAKQIANLLQKQIKIVTEGMQDGEEIIINIDYEKLNQILNFSDLNEEESQLITAELTN